MSNDSKVVKISLLRSFLDLIAFIKVSNLKKRSIEKITIKYNGIIKF